MNQKGFIIAPVLVWVLLTVSGLFVGTVVVKEGLISVDLSEKITHDGSRTGARVGYQSYCNPEQGVVIYENEKMPFVTDEGEQVLWTQGDIDCYKERKLAEKNIQVPIPTPLPPIQPKPTQKPVVQQGIQTNQNTQQPTHDGSRTGRIVDYRSLCEGKVIKVYENELVPYKRITGEMIYTTKGDIKCYEDQINQLKKEAFGTQNTQTSTINCYNPSTKKTYQVSKETCDKWVQEYEQGQNAVSSLNNSISNSYEKYKNCMAEVEANQNSCKSPCESKYNEDYYICKWAYGTGGNLGLSVEKYGECLNEVGEERNKCTKACSDTYIQQIQNCPNESF